jgi:Ca2+-binding EF-hand superfamily protein
LEPSQDRKGSSAHKADDISPEELNLCRSGARKIIQAYQGEIIEAVNSCDKLNEGLVSREDLLKTIESRRVPDLTPAELQILLKACDRGSKGYLSSDKFVEKLKELVSESKDEAALRLFAMNCKR